MNIPEFEIPANYKLIYEYIPEISEHDKLYNDIPDKYIILEDEKKDIIIYGYYGKYRKEWLPNPRLKDLVKHLIYVIYENKN